ncbi:hypothetical protein [Nitrosospira sp. Nl5]|uniref:hypothetical protein n=1 Tax=Nitrosospira sp. Nl5 TaxID=200120 RepID=UPI000B895A78|nr:hypothetical protein [Nitrosospira sp. Nl5]
MEAVEFLAELALALREYRYGDIRDLTNRIDPFGFNLSQIKKTLSIMRRKRRFADMERTAGIFIASGQNDPVIRRAPSRPIFWTGRTAAAITVGRE